jgi:hypothetical protein
VDRVAPKEAKSRVQEWIVNQQAIVSNVNRLFEKADLCAIISKEFPDETMHCIGDRHENGIMCMNIGGLQGCDRRINGEAIL